MAKKGVHHKTAHRKSSGESRKHDHHLHPKKLGIALGLTASIYILILSVSAAWLGWGTAFVHMLSSVYVGYNLSFLGILLGMVWAFVDFFVAGLIFACIFNKVQKCECRCSLGFCRK